MNVHSVYRPFLRHFRSKRMVQFAQLLRVAPHTSVLDVGGDLFNWSLLPVRPRLTILNVSVGAVREREATFIIGDGRRLPFRDCAFDIAFSNSVIEHVGNAGDQQLFAREIARVGVRYYVQTPNSRFPVEPHVITPFIHFLTKKWQRRLLRNFTVWGLLTRPTAEYCENFLRHVRLLDRKQLRGLFPEAQIHQEKFLGLTKSLIAVGGATGGNERQAAEQPAWIRTR